MRALLDTHTLLWFALNDPQLSPTARKLILDPAWQKLVSPASYWEIAIKIGTGKYALALPYDDFMHDAIDQNGFSVLPIQYQHTTILTSLPHHHRDPFDRLLVAQAMVEGLAILSADPILDSYPIQRIW